MAKGYNLEQTGPQVQEAINKSLNLTTATQSKEGLMSAQDKQKLDSLDSALAGKVDKVQGKGLSTNDYDNTEKGKVASAYQKPVGGIPASDLAEGVIPDTSQFITKTVNDLANYYLKTETYSRSETYTKSEVNALIALIKQFTYQVVSELPEASESTMYKLYLVPSADPQTQNVKDEYITVRSGSEGAYTYAWEQIGSTAIDLSGYVTTTALNTALSAYTTTADLTTILAAKQDVIADLSTIRSGAASGATAVQPEDLDEYKDQVDSEIAAFGNQSYVEAWNGTETPTVANIPAGVTVEYGGTNYTGTLAASADTLNKIYLVKNGVNYDKYITSKSGDVYSWAPNGSTAIDLSDYATKEEVTQLREELNGLVTRFTKEVSFTAGTSISHNESKVNVTIPSGASFTIQVTAENIASAKSFQVRANGSGISNATDATGNYILNNSSLNYKATTDISNISFFLDGQNITQSGVMSIIISTGEYGLVDDYDLLNSFPRSCTSTAVTKTGEQVSSVSYFDKDNTLLRKDDFTYSEGSIVETRVHKSGRTMTITTNLETLNSTIVWS